MSVPLKSWVRDLEDATRDQANKATRLPIVWPHVALMPDAHVGIGATVGSVIPCDGAVIPSAVGVDLGCGMIAVRTDLVAIDLPDDLTPLLHRVEQVVPAGVGQGHESGGTVYAQTWFANNAPTARMDDQLTDKAVKQFGSLGSGNHFFEVCLDESDRVWVVLHSGSRGVGNVLANMHIDRARALHTETALEDPDLAWFVQNTAEFDAYIEDMLWSQRYAFANREAMMNAALVELFAFVGRGAECERVNCHHNFCQKEHHFGRELWVTRKGAIQALIGQRGVIPGSMGTRSYIVEGLGNTDSFSSSSHGAGRRMSRAKARKTFSPKDLRRAMEGKTWLADRAHEFVDEIPGAYKDIDEVMEAQRDLTKPLHTLRQILNYKGT